MTIFHIVRVLETIQACVLVTLTLFSFVVMTLPLQQQSFLVFGLIVSSVPALVQMLFSFWSSFVLKVLIEGDRTYKDSETRFFYLLDRVRRAELTRHYAVTDACVCMSSFMYIIVVMLILRDLSFQFPEKLFSTAFVESHVKGHLPFWMTVLLLVHLVDAVILCFLSLGTVIMKVYCYASFRFPASAFLEDKPGDYSLCYDGKGCIPFDLLYTAWACVGSEDYYFNHVLTTGLRDLV